MTTQYDGQGMVPMNQVQRAKATMMMEAHGHELEERMEGDIAILICPVFRSRWAVLSDGQTIGSGYKKECSLSNKDKDGLSKEGPSG